VPHRAEKMARIQSTACPWNAFPAVPDLDAKCRSTPAAADEDTPAGQRMIERVAHQIAQDTVEQRGMGHNLGACRQETQTHSLPPRRPVELLREALQNRLEGTGSGRILPVLW
jgi:hypothetical protein